MSSLRQSRWAALIVVGFAVLTDYLIYGAITPLTPYSPAGKGSDAAISILYGAYSVGVLCSTPIFGRIADRLGYRTVMRLAVGLSVPAILLMWHSDGLALTLIGRFFQGGASAATWTAGFAVIAARYRVERVRMIGLTLMASTGGSVIGPIMAGALYRAGGYALPFVVLCGFAAIDAALRFSLLPPDPPHEGGGPGLIRLLTYRSVTAPAIAVAIAAGSWGILEPLLPRHLERTIGAGPAEVGLIFTLATIVYGLTSPLVSFATERLGMTGTAVVGMVLMAIMLPPLGIMPSLILTGVILCATNAGFAFLLNPTSAALGDAIEQRGLSCYGTVYAIYNIAYAVGMMAASGLGASLSGRVNVSLILLCVSLILLAGIPVIFGVSKSTQNGEQVQA